MWTGALLDGGTFTRGPRLLVAAALTVVAAGIVVGPHVAAQEAATSALHPVDPCRLIDTRDASQATPDAGATVAVQVAGRCDVPDDATAAAVTVTVVQAHSAGHATVWSAGDVVPEASLLNFGAGEIVANSGLFGLDDSGALSVSTSARADLIVDVTAYFAPATESTAGRYVPVPHHRLIDTRVDGRPAPGTAVTVSAPSIPSDATAVSVNLTTTRTWGPGWFTAYAAGRTRPHASVLNVDRRGQTRASSALVPVADGAFEVYTSNGDHVIVDITGYFTGPSAPSSSEGLFVPSTPTRVLDTRRALGPSGGPRVHAGGAREVVPFAESLGSYAAVSANLTVTETASGGWWRLGPAGVADGGVSTANADRGRQTVANSSITAVSERGIVVHGTASSDVMIDITGWFTGRPAEATLPVPANDAPFRTVTIISDSAMAGLRWNHAYAGLRGFHAVPLLESCRRLVYPSCRGREGYRPRTALAEIHLLPTPTTDDILVLAVGYNDWDSRFASDFDHVIDAARAKGFVNIVWVSYREGNTYRLPGDVPVRIASYRAMNSIVDTKLASGSYPDVRVWDLNAYTAHVPEWFTTDGVHQRAVGSWRVADWLSQHVAALDGKPCPGASSERVAVPCVNPDREPARG